MSTLTFRHGLFIGNPIIPCSFFIHSKLYHIDHREFLDAITETTTALLTKRVNLITDREFKFSGIFLLVHICTAGIIYRMTCIGI